MSESDSRPHRPIHIDFDDQAGDDVMFKEELIKLLINDMTEMQKSICIANKTCTSEFLNTLHKIATTISILNDQELNNEVGTLRDHYRKVIVLPAVREQQHVMILQSICVGIIQSLRSEIDPIM